MADQDDDTGIPLWHVPNDTGHKLLELPPELVELLQGENQTVLTIESSPTTAVLKARGKSYALRQKNTSNALILVSPAPTGTGAESEGSDSPALATVATLNETIELVPQAGSGAPAPVAKGKWHERFGRSR